MDRELFLEEFQLIGRVPCDVIFHNFPVRNLVQFVSFCLIDAWKFSNLENLITCIFFFTGLQTGKILKPQSMTQTNHTPIHDALTRSIQYSETSIDFVQGPPGSRREWVKNRRLFLYICTVAHTLSLQYHIVKCKWAIPQ